MNDLLFLTEKKKKEKESFKRIPRWLE